MDDGRRFVAPRPGAAPPHPLSLGPAGPHPFVALYFQLPSRHRRALAGPRGGG